MAWRCLHAIYYCLLDRQSNVAYLAKHKNLIIHRGLSRQKLVFVENGVRSVSKSSFEKKIFPGAAKNDLYSAQSQSPLGVSFKISFSALISLEVTRITLAVDPKTDPLMRKSHRIHQEFRR